MASVASAMFIWAEAPVTLFAGAYSLAAPLPFVKDILPPDLWKASAALDRNAADIVAFAVQIYGLVLLLLASAEFMIFKLVKGEVKSKKALLIPMAICDIIHVVVFAASWCFDAKGKYIPLETLYPTWQTREWIAVATNVPMVMVFFTLRVVYLMAASEPATKQKKM